MEKDCDGINHNDNPDDKSTETKSNHDLIPEVPPPITHKTERERTYNKPDPTPLWKIVLDVGAIVIGIIVASIYYCQLVAMREELKQTKIEVHNSADNFKAQERAYIVVDHIQAIKARDPFCFNDSRMCLEVWYNNGGATPAKIVRRSLYATSSPNAKTQVEGMIVPFAPDSDNMVPMSAGKHRWDEPIESRESNILKGEIWAYGAVQYYDLFKGYHVTRFCFHQTANPSCDGWEKTGCFGHCEFGDGIDMAKDMPSQTH